MAITACWKCSPNFDRLLLSLLQRRHALSKYCMSGNSWVFSSTRKQRDGEWWGWKFRNNSRTGKVSGASFWKYFWQAPVYQYYTGILGPLADFTLPFKIKQKAGQAGSSPSFKYIDVSWGIEARTAWNWDFRGGGGLRSRPSSGSLLPRARWTVLASDTLMYELQFLLPLPLSTEKQVCWSVPLDLSVGWIKIALEIELGAGLAEIFGGNSIDFERLWECSRPW